MKRSPIARQTPLRPGTKRMRRATPIGHARPKSSPARKAAKGKSCMVCTNEEWRPVVGFESTYQVSNAGRVRSIARRVRARDGFRMIESCVLKQKRCLGVYYGVQLCDGRRRANKHVHRLVAEAFLAGSGAVVRHLNGDGFDNRIENLRFGSYAENEADKRRHGRVPTGESHPNHKLSQSKVSQIRESCESDATLAKMFEVSRYAIYSVRKGLTWVNQ